MNFVRQIVQGSDRVVEYYADANNRIQGEYLTFDSLGNLLTRANYINDRLHGIKYSYYFSGELQSETTYDMGFMHGPFKRWCVDGYIVSYKVFNKGACHGKSYAFAPRENGGFRLARIRNYDMGKLSGPSFLFGTSGFVMQVMIYESDSLLAACKFESDGSLREWTNYNREKSSHTVFDGMTNKIISVAMYNPSIKTEHEIKSIANITNEDYLDLSLSINEMIPFPFSTCFAFNKRYGYE